ncbi:uncharacterized protein LOC108743623 [Agrilus planipennis]|uniref:Uncharacterized protein LOC108743623 n=1 Tax=Agrilus planipennis TaxID=224129 RepID=A0A1W4XFC7_AGRPL|nr:uncharacterized protein LOC108743623 [Agrilus planipennis]
MLGILTLIIIYIFGCVAAPARKESTQQVVDPAPGVIPVYIRPGDTPLEDINPDLAKAFRYNEIKYGRYVHPYRVKSDGVLRGKIPVSLEDLNEVSQDNDVVKPKRTSKKIVETTREPIYFSYFNLPYLE